MMTSTFILLLLFFLLLIGLSYWISTLLLYSRRQPITRTPTAYGLAYEDVNFRSKDGLLLKGWWLPAVTANASAPVIVLLHPHFGNRHGLSVQHQGRPRLFDTDVDLLKMAQACHRAGFTVFMFDFRSHGESQRGLCAGGLTEDQDVMGAVDYVFQRMAETTVNPAVGIIGFGLGAAAALAAVGREKGGAEVIRVFSGDSEGGSGFITIPPPTVKRLRFLVAVQPASLGVLLHGYLHTVARPLAWVLPPLVDKFCQWRGGYPLAATFLLKCVQEAHVPVLYLHARSDPWDDGREVQRFYDATPGVKQINWIEESFGRLETYAYVTEQPALVLALAAQHIAVKIRVPPYPC
ncbi:MAG: alpha/beta hydrolase [Caldilineaceae bacterium]